VGVATVTSRPDSRTESSIWREDRKEAAPRSVYLFTLLTDFTVLTDFTFLTDFTVLTEFAFLTECTVLTDCTSRREAMA
jgi:hypothetical protein